MRKENTFKDLNRLLQPKIILGHPRAIFQLTRKSKLKPLR